MKKVDRIHDLTDTQKNILNLYINEGLTIKQISSIKKVSRQAIYKTINLLIKKGIINKNKVKKETLDEDLCYFCDFRGIIHTHHIIMLSKGGSNDKNNLIKLCPNHHSLIHNDNYSLISENGEYRLINNITKDSIIQPVDRLTSKVYLTVRKLMRLGFRPSQIAKELNVSKQAISKHIKRLKDSGEIRKVGYGTWEIIENVGGGNSKPFIYPNAFTSEIRGHAFKWILTIPILNNWDKRIEFLGNSGVIFKGSLQQQFFKFNGKTVQLCNHRIIIYEPKDVSYFGNSAEESYKFAFAELMGFLVSLEGFLKVSLRIRGEYVVGVSFPHFARVKDALAVQCNKEGRKLVVRIDEHNRFLIDNSFNLNEAEVQGRDSVKLMDDVYVRSIKELFDSGKTPMDLFGEVERQLLVNVKMQGVYNENIKTHIKAIQELALGVRELRSEIKRLRR